MDCKLGDVDVNILKIRSIAEEMYRVHPDIMCFPELATTGYLLGKKWRDLAETVPGRSTDELAKIASESGSYLICGVDEKDHEGKIYDSAVLFDPNGKISGVYHKVHLWDQERKFFTPGNLFPVFKTKLGTLGIGICYDLEFPESARKMAEKGAELLFFPSAQPDPVSKQIDSYVQSRSSENCVFVAFSNRIGSEKDKISFFGHSQIVSPDAKITIAKASDHFVQRDIGLKSLVRLRKSHFPYLRQMRPEVYAA
jgi:predicted amidohydrolase